MHLDKATRELAEFLCRDIGMGAHVSKRRVRDPRRVAINFFLKSAFVHRPAHMYYARPCMCENAEKKKKKKKK